MLTDAVENHYDRQNSTGSHASSMVVDVRLRFDHCHANELSKRRDRTAERRLIAVLLLSVVFMVGEFIGGAISNSTAVMTDAAHMLADSSSFAVSLLAIYLGRRQATARFTYGYARAETLGALASVITIWILTGVLFYMATVRIINIENIEIHSDAMLYTSACGVAFNLIMMIVLRVSSISHSHSHGGTGAHSHGGGGGGAVSVQTRRRSRNSPSIPYNSFDATTNGDSMQRLESSNPHAHSHDTQNINVRAAFIHVIGDLLQSVGILFSALLIKFYKDPKVKLADPLCTYVFSVLVMFTTFPVIRDILFVLLDGSPLPYDSVRSALLSIPNVSGIHSLHCWSLTPGRVAATAHLIVDEATTNVDAAAVLSITQRAKNILQRDFKVVYATVQVEPSDGEVSELCKSCKPLV